MSHSYNRIDTNQNCAAKCDSQW